MNRKFYIADWHYGHENIISYDGRPFDSVMDMNEGLIERWNKAVDDGDLVYILGDMFWCKPKDAVPVLARLNGQKILVRGNHDNIKPPAFQDHFVKITDYLEVRDGDRNLVLCHYPMPSYKNNAKGWVHLYGHVHSSYEWHIIEHTKRKIEELYDKHFDMINVGAMMPYIKYTPRMLDEILAGRQEWEDQQK